MNLREKLSSGYYETKMPYARPSSNPFRRNTVGFTLAELQEHVQDCERYEDCKQEMKRINDEYNQDQKRLENEFIRDLEQEYDTDRLSTTLRQKIYHLAYEAGHSSGYGAIANHYPTYADLAILAYEAGSRRNH
jgi:hypothetical protein